MHVPEKATDNLKALPPWVKCSVCSEKPRENDWLIEIVPNSNALIHQSCAAKQGKLAGLNVGTIQGDLAC